MKTETWAHIAAIAGGVAAVGTFIYAVTRPDSLIGTTVRVPLSLVQLTFKGPGGLSAPIPSGLPGNAAVAITSVEGNVIRGQVLSFEAFGQILGQNADAFAATFSRNAIIP